MKEEQLKEEEMGWRNNEGIWILIKLNFDFDYSGGDGVMFIDLIVGDG